MNKSTREHFLAAFEMDVEARRARMAELAGQMPIALELRELAAWLDGAAQLFLKAYTAEFRGLSMADYMIGDLDAELEQLIDG